MAPADGPEERRAHVPVAGTRPCGVEHGGAGGQQRVVRHPWQRSAAAARAQHDAGRGPPDEPGRGAQRVQRVHGASHGRPQAREAPAHGGRGGTPASRQQREVTDVPSFGGEQADAQPLAEPRRAQALGPGGQLVGRVGQVRRAQRRTGTVGAGGLDVPCQLGAGEPRQRRGVQVEARQTVVPPADRVGEGEERGVERHDPAKVLEHRVRALRRAAGRGRAGGERELDRGRRERWLPPREVGPRSPVTPPVPRSPCSTASVLTKAHRRMSPCLTRRRASRDHAAIA